MTLDPYPRLQKTERSTELFERALAVIPGGVNSPVRAFKAVGGLPRFIAKAKGAYLWDVDENQYIDYVMSWGPLIHGHAFAPIAQAIESATADGTSFGAPTEREVRLAELVVDSVPSIEMVRFVSSGTEATMSAIRVARAWTSRDLIVKFAGNYHGHSDSLLAQAGSGGLTLGVPNSPGVPASSTQSTIVVRFNDPEAVEQAFQQHGDDIAAVIVEPVAGNMGVIAPAATFLQTIRNLTQTHGALFICDEIITGFRLALGGAQETNNLDPDVTTLGKILGGGLPVGAYGGKRAIMESVSPAGPVYQAGTLSGNPLAMAAGLAGLGPLRDPTFYRRLADSTTHLVSGLREVAGRADVPVTINCVTGMLTMFFTGGPVGTLEEAQKADVHAYGRFFHAMLNRGIYLPPSQFEAWMLSSSHSTAVLDRTLSAAEGAFRELSGR